MRFMPDHLIYAIDEEHYNTYRLEIMMNEPIIGEALVRAAAIVQKRFPYFSLRSVKENEEYYYEHNELPFVVVNSERPVRLNSEESNYHMLALAYYDDKIWFDSSHYLTDGNGSVPFLKMLIYNYLHILHPDAEFDMDGIPKADDVISEQEMTDKPYPEEPLDIEPIKKIEHLKGVFTAYDGITGYSDMDKWTSFRITLPQKETMKYASSVDGSPATFISSLVYRALSDLNPDNHKPLVCGMQHQLRKVLRNAFSHSSHVNIVPINYKDNVRGWDIERLNTLGRGSLILGADNGNDALTVNAHILNSQKIRSMTLKEKHKYIKKTVVAAIGENTFEVSYTGRVEWSGLDRFLKHVTPYLDLSLSGGISVEIFSRDEYFDINIMQRDDDDKYIKYILKLLDEIELEYHIDEPVHFEIPAISGFQS